ncbi:hypothetical protein Tco_0845424 [Tanacetum coccineum]
MFSKCLTTRVTGWDQPPLQIMQMMYCFVNNIHVDYAELLWEGLHYSLEHPTTFIPYPRFTKIIIGHYMTNFLEILRRARDKYHNLNDDDVTKIIFNSGRYRDKVFGLDVPLTQSLPTESTQGTHRTLSAPRSPCLTLPAPVPTVDEADDMILQDTIQPKEIEKMVEEHVNVIDDSSIPRNDDQDIPGTRIKPNNDKESSEVEITDSGKLDNAEEEITNVVIPVNVNDEEEEITDEVYELKRREKGKIVEESMNKLLKEQSHSKSKQVDASVRSYMFGHILHVHPDQPTTTSAREQQYQLTLAVRPRDQDDPHDDAHPKGENSEKQQKMSEYETYMPGCSALSLINSRSFVLNKKDSSGLGRLSLSHYMFLAVIFNDDDIRTKLPDGIGKAKMYIYHPCAECKGFIYKNSKKEKRVMRHSEVHKFCDATLNRVLKGLKSYNNDVKYGYIQRDLTKEEVEYLHLFEEEIEERLKHRNQMRLEMFVNGRLGPRRDAQNN